MGLQSVLFIENNKVNQKVVQNMLAYHESPRSDELSIAYDETHFDGH